MTLRIVKTALVFAISVFYSLVVFNNATDYDSNYQFVRHVLMMDSTFPGNHEMWRALNQPPLHTAFYLSIIVWEALTMILCWWGTVRLAKSIRASSSSFRQAKSIAIAGLGLGLFQWLFVFLTVGGEWFLMWQSKTWNGQEAGFRTFAVLGIVLLLLAQSESEEPS